MTFLTANLDTHIFSKLSPDEFPDFDLQYESGSPAIWCELKSSGPPRFTYEMMRQIERIHAGIGQIMSKSRDPKILFGVSVSRIPGVFNFGGDLPFFIDCVRNQKTDALRAYAHACIKLVYGNSVGWGSDALTIALVQGDALGGGFESAISHDFVVAERSAKMGMPEILFNTFPGMGAYSFLCRKLDAVRAERMILSGKIYTAGELFDLGLVDVLAEDGKGRDEVRRLIGDTRRYEVLHALKRVRQRILPLDVQELHDVTDIWVENVMKIHASDLRRMERLVSAQTRRVGAIGQTEPAPV